jgi:hypothetical protein
MKTKTATIVAFFVAPIIPALYLSLAFPLTRQYNLLAQLVLFPFMYNYPLIAMLLFGYPAFLLGKRIQLITWWSTLVVGVLIGALMGVIAQIQGHIHLSEVALMSLLGGLSGLTFWAIWKTGRDEVESHPHESDTSV